MYCYNSLQLKKNYTKRQTTDLKTTLLFWVSPLFPLFVRSILLFTDKITLKQAQNTITNSVECTSEEKFKEIQTI